MQIFFVDEDPVRAAEMLCDVHVNKMATESAQLISSAYRAEAGRWAPMYNAKKKRTVWTRGVLPEELTNRRSFPVIYLMTHVSHPCLDWVRARWSNWKWVWMHGNALASEFERRYGNPHASKRIFEWFTERFRDECPSGLFDMTESLSPIALAMPAYCQVSSDPVECYREFYWQVKRHFARWDRAPNRKPEWFIQREIEHAQDKSLTSHGE